MPLVVTEEGNGKMNLSIFCAVYDGSLNGGRCMEMNRHLHEILLPPFYSLETSRKQHKAKACRSALHFANLRCR